MTHRTPTGPNDTTPAERLNLAELPDDMRKTKRWVLWREVPSKRPGGKPSKMPYYVDGTPRHGRLDTQDDMARLGSLEDAVAALPHGPWSGIGFALGPDGRGRFWQGIDVDDPDLAVALRDSLPGYVERSPSGRGLHALGIGRDFRTLAANKSGVEAYARARFFTVTTQAIGGNLEDLADFVETHIAPRHRRSTSPPKTDSPPTQQVSAETLADLESALTALDADPYETWIRIGLALAGLGDHGRQLWMTWSATSGKFDQTEAERKWAGFRPSTVDYRAVFHEAQTLGWNNPRARPRKAPPPTPTTEHYDETSPPRDAQERGPYLWEDAVFYLQRQITTGRDDKKQTHTVKIQLANFSAVVNEQRLYDDGIEQEHRTHLAVFRPTADRIDTRHIEIPTNQFSGMSWVTNQLGHAFVVNAGANTKDHLRAAIQTFSDGLITRRIFTHTGWREIDGELCYLHAGGAITANGSRTDDVWVDLGDELSRYRLPPPPPREQLAGVVRASLAQLRLVNDDVAAVQLARIYGPPLAPWLRLDFGFFVGGRTGTFKTEFAALAMAHYGDWSARALPENWETTENAMMLKAFAVKDALLEIDDYNPQGTASDQLALGRKADRVFRGLANASGRGRLTSDIKLRRSYFPRGTVSASGEDLPPGRSLRARLWLLELQPHTVELDILTECQRHASAGRLAAAMAGYVQWLASRADRLSASLPARYDELRAASGRELTDHNRIPANLAGMLTILETFFEFAREAGALAPAAAAEWLQRLTTALQRQARAQADLQEESEDAVRAVDLLRSAFTTGKAHVLDAGSLPAARPPASHAHLLGWKGSTHRHYETDREGQETARVETRYEPQGDAVGYFVQTHSGELQLWLGPDAVYTTLAKLSRDQGAGALRSQTRLGKALVERGFLLRGDGRNITHKHNRANLSPPRVWRMPVSAIIPQGVCDES